MCLTSGSGYLVLTSIWYALCIMILWIMMLLVMTTMMKHSQAAEIAGVVTQSMSDKSCSAEPVLLYTRNTSQCILLGIEA